MNARETRQYEMLMRVRDFGTTYRHLFGNPGAAGDAFADVATHNVLCVQLLTPQGDFAIELLDVVSRHVIVLASHRVH